MRHAQAPLIDTERSLHRAAPDLAVGSVESGEADLILPAKYSQAQSIVKDADASGEFRFVQPSWRIGHRKARRQQRVARHVVPVEPHSGFDEQTILRGPTILHIFGAREARFRSVSISRKMQGR